MLRSLGASKLDILRKVGLPRSMPYFFASLKVAIARVRRHRHLRDLGLERRHRLPDAAGLLAVPRALMFAGLAVIAIMGIATYAVFAVLEAPVTGWATRGQNTPLSGGG